MSTTYSTAARRWASAVMDWQEGGRGKGWRAGWGVETERGASRAVRRRPGHRGAVHTPRGRPTTATHHQQPPTTRATQPTPCAPCAPTCISIVLRSSSGRSRMPGVSITWQGRRGEARRGWGGRGGGPNRALHSAQRQAWQLAPRHTAWARFWQAAHAAPREPTCQRRQAIQTLHAKPLAKALRRTCQRRYL